MKDEIKNKIDNLEERLKGIIDHLKNNRIDVEYTIELAERMKELQSIIAYLKEWHDE